MTYSYSKKTTFVDSAGNVVNYETIKAGEPTTVYYTTVEGQPVVSKVVVNRTAPRRPSPRRRPARPPRRLRRAGTNIRQFRGLRDPLVSITAFSNRRFPAA